MRVLIAVLVFILLYLGLGAIPGMGANRNIAIVIGIILSIISVVFMPCSVLYSFGATYAVLFSFIILGVPMLGIGALLFLTPTPNRFVAGIKLIGVLLLWWLISEISYWAMVVAAGTN